MKQRTNPLIAACGLALTLALPTSSKAEGWALVGHVGVAWLEESFDDIEDIDDIDWTTGTADVALERRLFSPVWLGAGASFLFESDELDAISTVSPFAYGKLRLPLPFQPFAGAGVQWREATFDIFDSEDSNIGYLFMAGLGFKLVNIGIELEVRTIQNNFDFTEFSGWSLSPGVVLHF